MANSVYNLVTYASVVFVYKGPSSVYYASQMIYCRVSQDKWNMSILSHLDLVIFFFSLISILAVFTLPFRCSVCSREARSWAVSKIREVLHGEKVELKVHFLYGRFSTLGQGKQGLWIWLVGSESTVGSRLVWVTECGNVLARWQSGCRGFPSRRSSWAGEISAYSFAELQKEALFSVMDLVCLR